MANPEDAAVSLCGDFGGAAELPPCPAGLKMVKGLRLTLVSLFLCSRSSRLVIANLELGITAKKGVSVHLVVA